MMEKRYIHWDIMERARNHFTTMRLKIDVVVGIGNGGLPVAVLAHHVLQKPLYIIEASSYTEEHKRKKLKFKNLNVPKSVKKKAVLLVDDIFDSGITMTRIMKYLEDEMGAMVFPFVLVTKGMPHIQHGVSFLDLVKEGEWIVFPWETH